MDCEEETEYGITTKQESVSEASRAGFSTRPRGNAYQNHLQQRTQMLEERNTFSPQVSISRRPLGVAGNSLGGTGERERERRLTERTLE